VAKSCCKDFCVEGREKTKKDSILPHGFFFWAETHALVLSKNSVFFQSLLRLHKQ
jgi:hypothetical protein